MVGLRNERSPLIKALAEMRRILRVQAMVGLHAFGDSST
jgi:hypothetical protein